MKKYVKPELFYERYELTEQIAACAWDLNQANENVCGFHGADLGMGDWVILAAKENGCKITDFQGYCYYPSEDGMNTFNS